MHASASVRALPGRRLELQPAHEVQTNWLLAGLPRPEWLALERCAKVVELSPGTFFRSAGNPLRELYFPTSSIISLGLPLANGTVACAAIVGREGMLGISEWLGDLSAPYDLSCVIAGRAIRMPLSGIVAKAPELPVFILRMQRYLLSLQQHTARNVVCSSMHSVEQRLASWLLLARARAGSDTLSVTHESVARMLGVGRPFVTHMFSVLDGRDVIRHMRGCIQITDAAHLATLACEDYVAVETIYARGRLPNRGAGQVA
jgi:CRP-like cAMP-binding protein